MRILLLSLNYLPELTGIGKFSGEMAEWLAARGHEVRVIKTPPYYPEWRVHDGFSAWRYVRERLAGVDVVRCPLWVPQQPSGTKRVLNLLSFAASSAPAVLGGALTFRPDVVGVIKPPMFALPFALLAARMVGAKAWVHVQDFEIDVAFDMGLLRGRRLGAGMLGLEAGLLRRFDLATSISERMCERLVAKGVAQSQTALFPNWVDNESIYPLKEPNALRSEFGIDENATVALYSGNMGEKQGLETLIDVARIIIDDPNLVVVLAGEGAVRQRLENQSKGLKNLKFLRLQPLERLNDLLNMADVHLLPQRADAADLVMPSKLGGILASGRPLIAGAHMGTQVAREVDGVGLVVAPDDAVAMATALRTLAADSSLRKRLGIAARERANERWARGAVLGRLEKRLENLTR